MVQTGRWKEVELDVYKKLIAFANRFARQGGKKSPAEIARERSAAKARAASPAAILQNVTAKYKNANPNAIAKIIELQSMLVQLRVAPRQLKNGKPFVDGVFGDSTVAAIKKLYR